MNYSKIELFVLSPSGFATELVMESQSEMLSYFSPGWTSTMTGLPSVVFEAIQENVPTSDANDAYRALIEATCGLDEFIVPIIADGWENFLPGSDGGLVGEYRDYFFDRGTTRDFIVWRMKLMSDCIAEVTRCIR